MWPLLLGPGSLKAGQEAKQSLATLPACPSRRQHYSTLAHTLESLRACTGAGELGLSVSGGRREGKPTLPGMHHEIHVRILGSELCGEKKNGMPLTEDTHIGKLYVRLG